MSWINTYKYASQMGKNNNSNAFQAVNPESIRIVEVKSRKLRNVFIKLPWDINAGFANWLPPLIADQKKFFNPATNRSFNHCDTILLLAYHGKQPVGRIMGIINNTYNEIHGEKTARFGFIESYNSLPIAQKLISSVEEWAKGFGMTQIIGPYGFSDKDPQGLMIEGFEHMPILDSPNNMPYMIDLVEQCGYTKSFDCHGFINELKNDLPEHYNLIANRIIKNNNISILEPTQRKELKPLIIPILRLVNRTYSHLFGFIPMEEDEMKELAGRYLPVIDPRFLKVVQYNGEMIGFILGLPNFTHGFQKANGRLFPFGFKHILKAMKNTQQVDLMLGAVEEEHRGRGIEVAMALRLFDSCNKAGISTVEAHLVLESNSPMQAEMKRAGYKVHKKFRVFAKPL